MVTVLDLAFVVLAVVAVIGALPGISWFVAYYLYRPKVSVLFSSPDRDGQSIYWRDTTKVDGVLKSLVNIWKESYAELTIKIEFIIDKPWNMKERMDRRFPQRGLAGGWPAEGGFWCMSEKKRLPPGSGTLAISFPYEAKPEECNVKVRLWPEVRMSELGLPIYFGSVELKPLTYTFRIVAEMQKEERV